MNNDRTIWHLTYATRRYWPKEFPDPEPINGTGLVSEWVAKHDRIENWLTTIAEWHSKGPGDFHAEYLTDQYNVYRGRELIAVYMVE